MNPASPNPDELLARPDPLAPLAQLADARQAIAQWLAAAAMRGVALRPPPPEPTTCCGRGCNGCVWEGYYEALFHWQADADSALRVPGLPSSNG